MVKITSKVNHQTDNQPWRLIKLNEVKNYDKKINPNKFKYVFFGNGL